MLTSIASLMSMMGQFLSEREANDRATIDDYVEWLRRHDHRQAVNLILDNAELSRAIKTLLEDQHGEVVAKLGQLDQTLSSVAAHLVDFKPIARAMAIKSQLSDQAISILRQMNAVGTNKLVEAGTMQGPGYIFGNNTGPFKSWPLDSSRMIYRHCVNLVLLSARALGNRDGLIYTITRAGDALGDE